MFVCRRFAILRQLVVILKLLNNNKTLLCCTSFSFGGFSMYIYPKIMVSKLLCMHIIFSVPIFYFLQCILFVKNCSVSFVGKSKQLY